MIKNYLKLARRNLLQNKFSSAIKIGGLAIGMAVVMLIGLWIYDEFAYNKNFKNYNRIAHVMRHTTWQGEKQTGGESSPIPLANELQFSYGNDFAHVVLSTKNQDYIISNGDKKFMQTGRFMQADAPEMFTLVMREGNYSGLNEINSVFLSETLSRKLFGDHDPLNKVVNIDTKIDARVTGVYRDFPQNSEFADVSYIAPFDLFASMNPWVKDARNNWRDNSFPLYVQIAPHTTFKQVSAKIRNVMISHLDKERAAYKPEVFLQPMSNWHLYSEFKNGVIVTGERMKFIRICGLIGFFVLLLACFNFVNLSTARSEKRAREVGVLKSIGSTRRQLVKQFLSESLLITFGAFILSLGMVQLFLPWFNDIADKEISVLWTNVWFWVAVLVFIFTTSLFAGVYPAFYLSSLAPVKVLKGRFKGSRSTAISRKVLVVFQFTISVGLIIGTTVVYRQIQFARNRPIGYDRSGVIVLPKYAALQGKSEVLRIELLGTGVVNEVAESSSELTQVGQNDKGFEWRGKPEDTDADMSTLRVSYEYGKTVGWQFLAGRDFSRQYPTDSSGFIINEAASKLMGFENPLGEVIRCKAINNGQDYRILGVVKDMVMDSPFEPVRPAVFFLGRCRWIFIKIDPRAGVSAAVQKIETAMKKIGPPIPFEYRFVDEQYASKFKAEERIGKLASFFAVWAVLISCLGLFGLASFIAEQRTKEISVRKVLGASAFSIWRLLSRDFVMLVVLSCLIAIPVAYYFLNNWLQNYVYHTNISWWIFAAAVAGAMLITILTVSFQAIKAAIANPIKSLRTE